ncbi:P-loop containing nucleoside triphosphate hydrolase protein [Gigaspora margarita]|uniref:P-loop containing nucleoside triphosphate hydrolase protein n=1 Tax=Gigaspora margarita TaxID=4874 RepID=A0A8H3X192_GIGMA|nr:P-loop containing nucleoside triphosphate hydrolase protein [Gigaspora margarita]
MAWTQALLGLQAKKIHICGETSTVPPVKSICQSDCIVTFSSTSIFSLRCAVTYSSLPPETRLQQAKLFNDPNSGFDVLVASDAIGMGLNLNIRRIVFESIKKSSKSLDKLAGLVLKTLLASDGTREFGFKICTGCDLAEKFEDLARVEGNTFCAIFIHKSLLQIQLNLFQ